MNDLEKKHCEDVYKLSEQSKYLQLDVKHLQETIENRIAEAGITKSELGRRAGVPCRTVRYLTNEKEPPSPSFRVVVRLLNALGIEQINIGEYFFYDLEQGKRAGQNYG